MAKRRCHRRPSRTCSFLLWSAWVTVDLSCAKPDTLQTFEYEESVYYGYLPRNMRVYVWLEHHPELAELCAAAGAPVIAVDVRQLSGFGNPEPFDRPCFEPHKDGPLGYAVTFRTEEAGIHETREIVVTPRGYP